jgi:hypothetical protein
MIFKISSRFAQSDSRYEKPFHLAICDKSKKYTPEHQIVTHLSKRKDGVGVNRLNCRVRRNTYACWGLVELLVDGQWIRWYSIERLSQKKEAPKAQALKAGMYFAMSSTSQRWGDVGTAARTYNIDDL